MCRAVSDLNIRVFLLAAGGSRKDVLAHFQSVTRLYTVSCHVDDDRVGHRCEVIEESLVVRVMQNFITLAGKDLLMYEIEKVTCSQVSHASKIGVFTVPRRSRGRSGVRSRSVFGPRSMKRKTAFFDVPSVPAFRSNYGGRAPRSGFSDWPAQ
jgi:hypothetical protein